MWPKLASNLLSPWLPNANIFSSIRPHLALWNPFWMPSIHHAPRVCRREEGKFRKGWAGLMTRATGGRVGVGLSVSSQCDVLSFHWCVCNWLIIKFFLKFHNPVLSSVLCQNYSLKWPQWAFLFHAEHFWNHKNVILCRHIWILESSSAATHIWTRDGREGDIKWKEFISFNVILGDVMYELSYKWGWMKVVFFLSSFL